MSTEHNLARNVRLLELEIREIYRILDEVRLDVEYLRSRNFHEDIFEELNNGPTGNTD